MGYHVVLNRPTNLKQISEDARAGLRPRHSMALLAEELDAHVHDSTGLKPSRLDRCIGALTRTRPIWWTIARGLRSKLRPGDVVFCTGEDVGVPVAALCGGLPGVSVSMMVHYVDRWKGRIALRLFGMRRKVAMFYAVAMPQLDFISRFLKVPAGQLTFVWDQTDTHFFSPPATSSGETESHDHRPIIMSVGLEQRDYASLATATKDLQVDVRISGYSADTRILDKAFPKEIPENFSRRFYPWTDLLQLYREADIAVVSLYPNNHAAGVQALMEALACGRPVVVTATDGLQKYIASSEFVRAVPTGNPHELGKAIADLLSRPEQRQRLGECASAIARERHTLEAYIRALAGSLRGLSRSAPMSSGAVAPIRERSGVGR